MAVTLDGGCWNSLPPNEKARIVMGFWAGADSRTLGDVMDGSDLIRYPRDWLALPPKTTVQDITDYFDLLYKAPANREIRWDWAYVLAAMNARDDDSDDRLNLVKFLREHGNLPFSGSLVDVKAPDLIVVQSDIGRLDLHLEGLTSKGLSVAQAETSVTFLKGLTTSDSYYSAWLDKRIICSSSAPPSIKIVYSRQIFDSANHLSASVSIDAADEVCLSGPSISYKQISESAGDTFLSDRLYLNSFMLATGLALPDTDADPKWPSAVQNASKISEMFATDAKSKGWYAYGPQRISLIDKIVANGASLTP